MVQIYKCIFQVLSHFRNIFGAELRSIVNDPQKIDQVSRRVERLVFQIENADFDMFRANYKENWEAIMNAFYKEVRSLEYEAVSFIDQSFKTLRSAEAALEMLLKFKHLETRQIILDQLMLKFDGIMDQFMKEINIVNTYFKVSKVTRFSKLSISFLSIYAEVIFRKTTKTLHH